MRHAAELEERLAGSEYIAVEHDLFGSTLSRLAAHDRVLSAFAVA